MYRASRAPTVALPRRRCNFPAWRLRVVSSLDKGDARLKEPKTSSLKLGNKSCSGVESTHANPIRIYFRFWRAPDPLHLLRAPRGRLIAAYGQISFVPSLVSVSPILATYLTYGHVGFYPLNWSLSSCLSTYRVCMRARACICGWPINQLSVLKFNRGCA